MLIAIETAISEIEAIRTISGLIFTPFVSSLKKVKRPALDAGIGDLLLSLTALAASAFQFLSIAGRLASAPNA